VCVDGEAADDYVLDAASCSARSSGNGSSASGMTECLGEAVCEAGERGGLFEIGAHACSQIDTTKQ
jgi:hypothetical protein